MFAKNVLRLEKKRFSSTHVYFPAVAPPLAMAESWAGEAITSGELVMATTDPTFRKKYLLSRLLVLATFFSGKVEKENP